MFKKLFIHTKRSMKFIILVSVTHILIIGFIASLYKVSYSVNINGEMVGYTDNKSKLQTKINDYIENGESENAAFVQVEKLPEYKICLLKRNVEADDDRIFDMIKSDGTTYYRYYAILENQEEKIYVPNFAQAEEIVNKLKEKNSSNMSNITISEKYETELKEMVGIDDAVNKLYVKPKNVVVASKKTSSGSVNTSTNISSTKVNLGISLTKPVSGIISSRFGSRSSVRSSAHTGLDIATSTGTPVSAAAGGTVTFSGWKGSYGKLIVRSEEHTSELQSH